MAKLKRRKAIDDRVTKKWPILYFYNIDYGYDVLNAIIHFVWFGSQKFRMPDDRWRKNSAQIHCEMISFHPICNLGAYLLTRWLMALGCWYEYRSYQNKSENHSAIHLFHWLTPYTICVSRTVDTRIFSVKNSNSLWKHWMRFICLIPYKIICMFGF